MAITICMESFPSDMRVCPALHPPTRYSTYIPCGHRKRYMLSCHAAQAQGLLGQHLHMPTFPTVRCGPGPGGVAFETLQVRDEIFTMWLAGLTLRVSDGVSESVPPRSPVGHTHTKKWVRPCDAGTTSPGRHGIALSAQMQPRARSTDTSTRQRARVPECPGRGGYPPGRSVVPCYLPASLRC